MQNQNIRARLATNNLLDVGIFNATGKQIYSGHYRSTKWNSEYTSQAISDWQVLYFNYGREKQDFEFGVCFDEVIGKFWINFSKRFKERGNPCRALAILRGNRKPFLFFGLKNRQVLLFHKPFKNFINEKVLRLQAD
jgi:hypothetical protein